MKTNLVYLELTRAVLTIATGVLMCLMCVFGWLVYLEARPQPEVLEQASFCGTVEYPLHSSESRQAAVGKKLFLENCASCHNRSMKDDMTGPALGGVTERWSKYPKKDLYQFIRNSRKMIRQKHPQAVAIWKEWQPAMMNKFSNLTDAEIEAILLYVEAVYY